MVNTHPPIQQLGTLSLGVNRPRHEADFSLPCRVYKYIFLPAEVFMRRLYLFIFFIYVVSSSKLTTAAILGDCNAKVTGRGGGGTSCV